VRVAGLALIASACSAAVQSTPSAPGDQPAAGPATATSPAESVPATSTTTPSTTTSSTTTSSTTTSSTTTSTTTTTTTTTEPEPEPELDVYDPVCVVQVQVGESLSSIADSFDDETVTAAAIRSENNLGDDVIHPGQLLDVCPDNGVNDVTGETITERNAASVQLDVEAQQEKLNELFEGYGTRELLVDGISGPVTRQRLCAARLALGLPVSTDDMEPGSDEEAVLMAAETLPVPFTSAILADRWILVDRTCQIMFVGAGIDELVHVFPTSTGEAGYETRDQERSRVGRYNPALDNNGWHNSTTYPVAEDDPLSGNMYKPLYFDRGQAIHGANNVPTSPQSKGCARLRVEHQDLLIEWLGLADSGPTTSAERINVVVNVQGTWVER
jgi:LysM repeat protein